MKIYKYFLISCFLLITVLAEAQVKKGLKFIEKKQYDKALTAFEADLNNPKQQTAAEYSLALLFANLSYEKNNLETAFSYSNKAIASLAKVTPAIRKKLQDKNIGLMAMRKTREKIIVAALAQASKENTASAFNSFLKNYTDLTKPQAQQAYNNRNQIAFKESKNEKTGTAMENFWNLYNENCKIYSPDLYKIAEKELLEAYIRQNSWDAYSDFAVKYPENIYVKDATAAVKMQISASKNTIPTYKTFLESYPTSPFAKIALDSIYSQTLQSASLENCDYFVRTFPTYPDNLEVWKVLYLGFCKTATCPAAFYKAYPTAPKNLN